MEMYGFTSTTGWQRLASWFLIDSLGIPARLLSSALLITSLSLARMSFTQRPVPRGGVVGRDVVPWPFKGAPATQWKAFPKYLSSGGAFVVDRYNGSCRMNNLNNLSNHTVT